MESKESFVEKLLAKIFLRRKECLWGLFAICAVVVLLIVTLSPTVSYQHHLEFKKIIVKWQENPTDKSLFAQVEDQLPKDSGPFIQWDVDIAQTLMGLGFFDQAADYTERSIGYLRKESPEHAFFSETTLLMEKGLYQEALEKSIRLKEQMGKEESYLYFHNLLRIAILQKYVKNAPGELAAWKDCEDFLGWTEGVDTPLGEQIGSFYKEKNIDLKGYIQHRIEACSLVVHTSF